MQRWLTMSAAALGRAIAKGDIDPVDLAQTYLDAIDAHPFRSRIYTIVTRDRALAEAQAASERARLGQRKSALDGVPVSWKDLFDSANVATEAGSVLLRKSYADSRLRGAALRHGVGLGLFGENASVRIGLLRFGV